MEERSSILNDLSLAPVWSLEPLESQTLLSVSGKKAVWTCAVKECQLMHQVWGWVFWNMALKVFFFLNISYHLGKYPIAYFIYSWFEVHHLLWDTYLLCPRYMLALSLRVRHHSALTPASITSFFFFIYCWLACLPATFGSISLFSGLPLKFIVLVKRFITGNFTAVTTIGICSIASLRNLLL